MKLGWVVKVMWATINKIRKQLQEMRTIDLIFLDNVQGKLQLEGCGLGISCFGGNI